MFRANEVAEIVCLYRILSSHCHSSWSKTDSSRRDTYVYTSLLRSVGCIISGIKYDYVQVATLVHFPAAKVNGKRFLGVTLAKYDLKNISGTVIEYHRPSDGPEVLVAAGPTTDDIQLEVNISC